MVLSYSTMFGQGTNPFKTVCVLTEKASEGLDSFSVPFGAQHKEETVWRRTAPEDFHAVLALMQVVNVTPCNMPGKRESRLALRAIRLIERDPVTGNEQVVSAVTDFSSRGQTVFTGELFPRIPNWYGGSSFKPVGGMFTEKDGYLVIDVSRSPQFIYHGWTDPKVATKPGMTYSVEMEVKISGLARLQIGVDYWREIDSEYNLFDSTCEKSNNCEGYLSRWFGPTDGWQTLRVPESFDNR